VKDEDVKIGMKVVPHDKSIGTPLSDSVEWKWAQQQGQPFLLVKSQSAARDCWGLAYSSNESFADTFLASDFAPYIEPTKKHLTKAEWLAKCEELWNEAHEGGEES